MKYAAWIALALLVPFSAHAGWSNWGTITSLHTNQGPSRSFVLGVTVADAGCSEPVPVIMLSGTQATDGAKEVYATVLSAFLSGREIRVYADYCWSSHSTPIVTAVEVR